MGFQKRKNYGDVVKALCILCLSWLRVWGVAAEPAASPASILESRISTSTVVEGESFRYSLKFDYADEVPVYPVQHFTEQGFTILETRKLKPQRFAGRVIQQREYTVTAPVGAYSFSPITLRAAGPRINPLAVPVDPIQVTVVPAVEVAITSNSPILLGEPLTATVIVTRRGTGDVTAFPHEFQAEFQPPAPSDAAEPEDGVITPTPPLSPPPALAFALGDPPEMASEEVEGQTIDAYTFETLVEPQQPGVYVVADFSVTYRTPAGEEREAGLPEPVKLFVLHPNTGPAAVETDYGFLIGPGIALGVALLASGIGIALWRIRQARRGAAVAVAPPLPPAVVARRELALIQEQNLPARGEFKAYYTLISEVVRKFLGAEFGFHVLERTTEEVMQDIRRHDVPPAIVDETARFLREADMVKFAKYMPLLEEAEAAMQQALRLVDDSVEYHQHHHVPGVDAPPSNSKPSSSAEIAATAAESVESTE